MVCLKYMIENGEKVIKRKVLSELVWLNGKSG